jgi:transposase
MKRVIKQVLGIDVAQNELVVCLGTMTEDISMELYARKAFANTPAGFEQMTGWVNKLTDAAVTVKYVMEATGVYHERLAYFLAEKGMDISIIMPNKISNYMRTLDVKTITDKTAAEAIARFGLERSLDTWQQPLPVYKALRQLTRERDQLIQERTVIKNQLHAEQAEARPNKASIERMNRRIALLNEQEKEITVEITTLVKGEERVKEVVELLCSVPGVGILTAVTVLGETGGFDLIRNKRQLASYAGLDVKEKQSGTSVKGKPSISKKGNKYLRKALHLPALAAIRCDERFKNVSDRLLTRHGIKMKAVVAIQRKLLEMMYILYKTGKKYDENYLTKNEAKEATAA